MSALTVYVVVHEVETGTFASGDPYVILSVHEDEAGASEEVAAFRNEHRIGADESFCRCHGEGMTYDAVPLITLEQPTRRSLR
jgi:hypothetical protein